MMPGSYNLQKNEIRENRKLFQPPILAISNLLSSHDRSETNQQCIHQLSNVQEKSGFSSENEAYDKQDIKEFIDNINTTELNNELFSTQFCKHSPSIVRRIEDQNIIVVEQQNQLGSNSGGKESVILQQVDFDQQDKHLEQTPEWDPQQNNYKHEGVSYTIKCVQAPNNFLIQENQNISDSTPYDFSSSEFKSPKVRNSKNTCVEHQDLRDSNHVKNFKEKNKSCIAPPINRSNSKGSSSPQSINQLDIKQILSKWNTYIYPELTQEYLGKKTNQEEQRRKTISYNAPIPPKQCVSSYQNQGSRLRSDDLLEIKTKKVKEEKQAQTEFQNLELKLKQNSQKIKFLEQKLIRTQEQNLRLLTCEKKRQEELTYLRQNLTKKSEEIQNLRSTLEQTNQSKNKLWIDESKRMQNKNKELQKIINDQNFTIRVFEQKQDVLQKRLHQTVSYIEKSSQIQKSTQFKSIRMQKFDTFCDSNNIQHLSHQICNEKIQALQQYIFDIQQQRVGIDLQIQRRLKIATEKIEQQIRKNANQEFKLILTNVMEQNFKLREINNQMNLQRKQLIQQYHRKQTEILQRQDKVKRMHDQLVSQWEQQQKNKGKYIQKKNTVPSSINPMSTSPRSANMYQMPFSKSQANQINSKLDTPLRNNYMSNKTLFSPSNHKSALNSSAFERESSVQYFKQYQKMSPSLKSNLVDNFSSFQRIIFGRENRNKSKQIGHNFQLSENSDLYLINSKVQKLRSQINRELDLIH